MDPGSTRENAATTRRPRPLTPGPETETLPVDLQSLLATATRRLVESGAESALAWALRPDGSPFVVAAAFEGDGPVAPSPDEFAALAALPRTTVLIGPDAPPALGPVAERHHCSAAAPIRAGGAEASAVLLLTGAPSPRVMADLDAIARRMAAPAATALALQRLDRLDGEVRELDRLAALGRLTSEIVHEVRNPLVSIKTFLQLLPERRDEQSFFDEFLPLANNELRRMERLLDLVIDHARPPSDPSDGNAALAEILTGTAELLRHHALGRGVTLAAEVPDGIADATLGTDRLRQVVMNLTLNAVSATPEGGRVLLRGSQTADTVVIEVCDTGPGIPSDRRRAIFEPFFSTRSDRSGGLGLAIARRLVEEAAGTIAIRDAAGGGAVFRVELPIRV